MKKTFYRVSHALTGQGLWYDAQGAHTGLIHDELSFCKNHALPMDFDPALVGYVSVVETLDQLYGWFTQDDILRLQERDWYVTEYEADVYKWYERFGHYAAASASMTVTRTIILTRARLVNPVFYQMIDNQT